jgi:hypothetical protein
VFIDEIDKPISRNSSMVVSGMLVRRDESTGEVISIINPRSRVPGGNSLGHAFNRLDELVVRINTGGCEGRRIDSEQLYS